MQEDTLSIFTKSLNALDGAIAFASNTTIDSSVLPIYQAGVVQQFHFTFDVVMRLIQLAYRSAYGDVTFQTSRLLEFAEENGIITNAEMWNRYADARNEENSSQTETVAAAFALACTFARDARNVFKQITTRPSRLAA